MPVKWLFRRCWAILTIGHAAVCPAQVRTLAALSSAASPCAAARRWLEEQGCRRALWTGLSSGQRALTSISLVGSARLLPSCGAPGLDAGRRLPVRIRRSPSQRTRRSGKDQFRAAFDGVFGRLKRKRAIDRWRRHSVARHPVRWLPLRCARWRRRCSGRGKHADVGEGHRRISRARPRAHQSGKSAFSAQPVAPGAVARSGFIPAAH